MSSHIDAPLPPTLGETPEAPTNKRIILLGAIAAFGGMLFGYDGGYLGAVLGMKYFIQVQTGLDPATTPPAQFVLSASVQSLLTTILAVGQILGSFVGGDLADTIGRRMAVIAGTVTFCIGVILQTANFRGIGLLTAGRFIAGVGVGLVAGVVVLYIAETAPRKIRGRMIAGYQFFVTVGLLVASCVAYATADRMDSAAFRIPIGIQLLWGLILIVGMCLVPETPRYKVQQGKHEEAARILSYLRSQPVDSVYVQSELQEIIQNSEYEAKLTGHLTYWTSWGECFKGSLRDPASHIRRSLLGFCIMMWGQLSGINFVIYFGVVFFTSLQTSLSPFLIGIVITMVNVLSTIISFWTLERFGRRPVLLTGYAGMAVSQIGVAISGSIGMDSDVGKKVTVAFVCLYTAFFAGCAGPADFVLIGEIFPVSIRSRGVGISISAAWLFSLIVSVISPYLIGVNAANLGPKVCYIFGGFCVMAFVFVYFMVPELKGHSLENVDLLMRQCVPRKSANWKPIPETEVGMMDPKKYDIEMAEGKPTVSHID